MRRWIGSALASALATLLLPGAAGAGRDLTPTGTVQVITFPWSTPGSNSIPRVRAPPIVASRRRSRLSAPGPL